MKIRRTIFPSFVRAFRNEFDEVGRDGSSKDVAQLLLHGESLDVK